jgi:hypothetical protein
VKLGQIALINEGYPFRGKIPEGAASNLVAVQMKDVVLSQSVDWKSCINTTLTGKREPDYLKKGDILVAARGNHNYAVQIDESFEKENIKAVAAPHFFVIKLTSKALLPEYLVWLLNQKPCQRFFEQNAEGTLTKSIRRSVLESAPVVLPTLEKQKSIIAMAKTFREEQKLMMQLIENGEKTMSIIARDLYKKVDI